MSTLPDVLHPAIAPLEGLRKQFDHLALEYPDIKHVYLEYPHGSTPDLPIETDLYYRGSGVESIYETTIAVYRENRWLRLKPTLQNGARNWKGVYFGDGITAFEALAQSADFVLTSYPVRLPLPCEIEEIAQTFGYCPSTVVIVPCGEHRWARILHWLAWAGTVMPIGRLVWDGKEPKYREPCLDATLKSTSIIENLFLRSALAIKWIIGELSTVEGPLHISERRPERRALPKRIGRPPDTDQVKDRRIAEAWKTGAFRAYQDLDAELGMARGSAKKAVDRHRHRESDGKTKTRE
jgi:hypothetical protein